jgi:hypothetical protein
MNCNCCNNLHKTTALSTAGLLTVTNPNNVGNYDRFCLVLTICPDSVITSTPVAYTVTINGTAVPVVDRWGYPITSDRLRTRTLYKGRYVTVDGVSHVTLINVCDDVPASTVAATASTTGGE